MSDQAPLIELRGVGRSFGADAPVQALADVSLTIGAGEFVCVTGPSGAGKSTLLYVLGCLERHTEGEYLLAGEDVGSLDASALARRRGATFGFVFQGFNLLPGVSARDNAQLPGRYAGLPRRAREARADELLAALGVSERGAHLAEELSGGEKQRAAIARALMNDPQVILADEPAGALDSAQGEAVMEALRGLAEQGRTVVVATHDRAAADAAPRHIELRDGRVVTDSGPPAGAMAMEARPPRGRGLGAWAATKLAATGGFQALWSRPLATLLTLLGIGLGAWAVVTALGLAAGAYDKATGTIARMGADTITVHGSLAVALTADDLYALRELPNVREVYFNMFKRLEVRRNAKTLPKASVTGRRGLRMPGGRFVRRTVERGAFLTPTDDAQHANVVVLNADARSALFPDGADPLGADVLIDGQRFMVKGVLAEHVDKANIKTIDFHTGKEIERPANPEFWVPFSTMLARFPDVGESLPGPLSASVQVADVDRVWETAAAIRDLLIRTHGTDAEGAIAFPQAPMVDAYRATVRNAVAVIGALAIVMLLVAGFGVMAVMLASASRRGGEIGLRMAVGARRGDIAAQFLAEAALLTAVGGAAGALLGFATATVAGRVAGAPVALDASLAAAAIGCAMAVGLAFGVVPARRAARLDPVAALGET